MPLRCAIASLVVLIGCGPERLVLSASGSDPAVDANGTDAGTLEDAWFMPCSGEDWECEPGMVCENESCVPCSALPNECTIPCVFGDPVPSIRNGCPVCVCPASQCFVHAECPYGFLCVGQTCQSCVDVAELCNLPCADGFVLNATVRNGCPLCECVPPTECRTDEDCGGPPMRCYPGAQCDEGYDGQPLNCNGNRCGLEGCDETYFLPCSAVGCPSGLMCMSSCPAPMCWCDPSNGGWMCDPECYDATCNPPY